MTPFASTAERRAFPRFTLPVAYTAVSVRREGRRNFSLRGHAYDISRSGVKIELDSALDAGESIDVRVHLPGLPGRVIETTGRVMRLTADEPGPVTVGIAFDHLLAGIDDLPRRAA